jgi:hypothetical protein
VVPTTNSVRRQQCFSAQPSIHYPPPTINAPIINHPSSISFIGLLLIYYCLVDMLSVPRARDDNITTWVSRSSRNNTSQFIGVSSMVVDDSSYHPSSVHQSAIVTRQFVNPTGKANRARNNAAWVS